MRIRRRPQILTPASFDSAAGEGRSGGGGVGESAAEAVVGKRERIVGTSAALHPTPGKGTRPWGGESVSWRPGQPIGGGRGGRWTGDGSDASCSGREKKAGAKVHETYNRSGTVLLSRFPKQQNQHKGKAAVEDNGVRGAVEESDGEDDRKPSAAQHTVEAHKAWNHIAVGGQAAAVAAAANSLGAEECVPPTVAANERCGELIAGAARKRKNIAWCSGGSRSERSPSPFSLSVKTDISNGGGSTSCMHGNDHRLLKDEGKEGEKQQIRNGRMDNNGNTSNNTSNRRRISAVLMEGSRCSRVNGRGWRCCQPTLVGYSLCEHHLGKGRLRSVSSVRCNESGGRPKQRANAENQLQSLVTVDVEEEEPKQAGRPRHGKRIGILKARSISSLLGQTSFDVIDHAETNLEAVAPNMVPAAPSLGLPAAVTRGPPEGT